MVGEDSCCDHDSTLSTMHLTQRKISRNARRRRKRGNSTMLREEEKKKFLVPGIGKSANVHRCRFVRWMPSAVNSVSWHPSGKKFAIGRANGSLHIYAWSSNSWRLCSSVRDPQGFSIDSIIWTPSGRLFTAGPFSSIITEWDISLRLPKSTSVDVPGGGIWTLALVGNNESMLAVASEDRHIRFFTLSENTTNGGEAPILLPSSRNFAFPGHLFTGKEDDPRILTMIWNSWTNQLVTGSSLGDIVIWDLSACSRLRPAQILNMGHRYGGMIWSLSLLSKGHVVVAGDSKGQLSFWKISSGDLITTHRVHEGEVLSVVSIPRSDLVIAAGVDPTLHCFKKLPSSNKNGGASIDAWTWITGAGQAPITIHRLDIRVMAVSPNGQHLISAGLDPDFLLHDLKSETLGRYEIFPYFDQIPDSFVSSVGSGRFLVTNLNSIDDISGEIWKLLPGNCGIPSLEFQFTLKDTIFAQALSEHWMALGIQHPPSIRLWRRDENDGGIWRDGGSIALSEPPLLLALVDVDKDGKKGYVSSSQLLWIVQPTRVSLVELNDSSTPLRVWKIELKKDVLSPTFIRATAKRAILGSTSSIWAIDRDFTTYALLPFPSLATKSFLVDVVIYHEMIIGIFNCPKNLSTSGSPLLSHALVVIWNAKGNEWRQNVLVPLAPPLSSRRGSQLLKGVFLADGNLILHSDRIYCLNVEYLLASGNTHFVTMPDERMDMSRDMAKVSNEVPLALPLILSTPRGKENSSVSCILALFANGADIVAIERPLEDIYAQLPPAFRRVLPFQRS